MRFIPLFVLALTAKAEQAVLSEAHATASDEAVEANATSEVNATSNETEEVVLENMVVELTDLNETENETAFFDEEMRKDQEKKNQTGENTLMEASNTTEEEVGGSEYDDIPIALIEKDGKFVKMSKVPSSRGSSRGLSRGPRRGPRRSFSRGDKRGHGMPSRQVRAMSRSHGSRGPRGFSRGLRSALIEKDGKFVKMSKVPRSRGSSHGLSRGLRRGPRRSFSRGDKRGRGMPSRQVRGPRGGSVRMSVRAGGFRSRGSRAMSRSLGSRGPRRFSRGPRSMSRGPRAFSRHPRGTNPRDRDLRGRSRGSGRAFSGSRGFGRGKKIRAA